jgi:hypothetical protein
MNGHLAQIVALTLYGNYFLEGRENLKFFPENSAFNFCKIVDFVDATSDKLKPISENPAEWFQYLKNRGTKYLQLIYGPTENPQISDRMSSAFVGGGGRWLIEANYGKKSDFWEARWGVKYQDEPSKIIWHATYGKIASGVKANPIFFEDLYGLKTELQDALENIEKLAAKYELKYFQECFQKALSSLSSNRPLLVDYYPDLMPQNYMSPLAEQVLAASQNAGVFGGMGSWNDLSLEDDKEQYRDLSDRLFSLLNVSIYSSVNSCIAKRFKSQENILSFLAKQFSKN